jgi:hypothetical protein
VRLFLKTLTALTVAASPWIAAHFGWAQLSDETRKVAFSLFGVLVLAIWDFVDFYIPREHLRRFGKDYCDKLAKTLRERPAPFPKMGEDIRLNVLYVRGLWLFSWFKWVANYGYTDNATIAPDLHLLLAKWQGVAGVAVASCKPQWATLWTDAPPSSFSFAQRWAFQTKFKLWGPQFERTAEVRAVLSIPLVRRLGGYHNPRGKVVGVMNLDAITEPGAAWLADPQKRGELLKFLADHGGLLAFLD